MLVLGTEAGCGKTVAIAGLAAALGVSGFRMQALKPLDFCEKHALNGHTEQQFLNKVTQQFIQAETIHAPSPWEVPPVLWNRIIEPCRSLQYPCLLEGPGQVATPWQIAQGRLFDSLDVARMLDLPILLVSRADTRFLEKTRSALTFIQSRGFTPLAFLAVETEASTRSQETFLQETLLLSQHYTVPFLGLLPHSPSISVTLGQQGNLIRLTQENIDLLPLQMGIGLTL